MSDQLPIEETLLAPLPAALRGHRIALRLLAPLMLLFLGVILVFYVLYRPSRVDGSSMAPALLDGDRLLSTKSYDSPRRGDVVVFYGIDRDGTRETLIKRVVAVPGQTVEVRDGVATVDGVRESGEFILDPTHGGFAPLQTVPPRSVFVMGDNRLVSLDSRHFGPIPIGSIAGRAVVIWSPFTRWGPVR